MCDICVCIVWCVCLCVCVCGVSIACKGEESSTRVWAMSATCKLCRHLNPVPPEVTELVKKYQTAVDSELQQLSHELIELIQEREIMNYVFENSAITDEIEIDESLDFLNEFVDEARKMGAREYEIPSNMDGDGADILGGGLKRGGAHSDKIMLQHKTDDSQSIVKSKQLGS